MRQFTIGDSDIKYWMTGPISNYRISLDSKFVDDYTVEIVINTDTPFTEDDNEHLHIRFNEKSFVSQDVTTLYNNEPSGNTNEVPVSPDLVKLAGQGTNGLITTSLIIIISSNLALGKSNELLWASINIIQNIYFMPLLSLYFPNHYRKFLTYLTSAKVRVDMIGTSDYVPKLSDTINNDAGMSALNQKYIKIGYTSRSILVNADKILLTIITGLATCIIVFSIKAIIITMHVDISPYKDILDEIKVK